MRAAVFKSPGQSLRLTIRPDPSPSSTQVVVKVGRCGICSTDLSVTAHETGLVPHDSILGHEYAGEIVEVGSHVSDLRVGDRVCALPLEGCGSCGPCSEGFFMWCSRVRPMWGGFAEFSLASERSCIRIDDKLSDVGGALAEPLAAGLHAVNLATVSPKSRVAVFGSGPIGLATAYWASIRGARVVMLAASLRNALIAQTFGTNAFIVNSSAACEDVRASLGGEPDTVFECTGHAGLIEQAIQSICARGTIVVAGLCLGTDHFKPMTAALKELTIRFSIAYSIHEYRTAAAACASSSHVFLGMVTDTTSLRRLPDYIDTLRANRHHCKVMLDPSLKDSEST